MERSFEGDQDKQLEIAIALSLRTANSADQSEKDEWSKVVVDLCDDAKEVTSSDQSPVPSQLAHLHAETASSFANDSKSSAFSMMGLDRKAMEETRLARLGKLTRPISHPATSSGKRSAEVAHLDSDQSTLQVNKKKMSFDHLSPTPPIIIPCELSDQMTKRHEKEHLLKLPLKRLPPRSKSDSSSRTLSTPSLRFPEGTVKKTWAYGFAREGDDIKIEEVLQRSTLQLAVFSSFQWDVEWLLRKVDTTATKVVFVMQAKDESTKQQYKAETAEMPNLRLCFPPMEGNVNCMHSKLMLLSHQTHLRIAIPTANLVQYDWGETGVMENSVFLIDLPRLPEGNSTSIADLTDFGKELLRFCNAMGLPDVILRSILNFDFAATRNMAFIHTIGGAHTDETSWRSTGYPGLGRAVQHLGMGTNNPIKMDFVASSVGLLNTAFLSSLYLAAQGDDGTTELKWRAKGKGKNAKGTTGFDQVQSKIEKEVQQNFRVYFPSQETVRCSTGGAMSAGVICLKDTWYNSPTFPKQVLVDCKSSRKGLLMHNKLLYVQSLNRLPSSSSNAPNKAWVYIGSANCSESAWGRLLPVRGKIQTPKLTCRNWECGVLLPVPPEHSERNSSAVDTLESFRGTAPAPMRCPGQAMNSENMPWFLSY